MHCFTNEKYRILVNWITKKVKSLFPLRDQNIYPVCKIYHGLCSCKENCLSESKCNVTTSYGKHQLCPTHDSGPAKHLDKNIQHSYSWIILANSYKNQNKRELRSDIYSPMKI